MIFCLSLIAFGFTNKRQGSGKKQWVVVIDPGHGGKDPGCHGVNFMEKNIALAVSLKLGHYIQDNDKNVKVVYTRTTDEFVSLNDRAEIANKNHADLFICIHLNASPNHDANGSATYVMGLKKSNGNLEVEKRENSSILFEKDYKTTYGGYDPDSPTGNIIFNMYQNLYLNQSLDLATKIQDEYAHIEKRKDNRVKQAGFLVLWRTAMPSLLTEIGFLTNPEEEKFMGTQKGEDEIAQSIFLAFEQYKSETENIAYDPKSYSFNQYFVQIADTAKMDTTQQPTTVKDSANVEIKKEPVKDSTVKKEQPKTQKHIEKDTIAEKPKTDTVAHTVIKHPASKDSNNVKVSRMKDAIKGLKADTMLPTKKADTVAGLTPRPHRTDSVPVPKKAADSVALHPKKVVPVPKNEIHTSDTNKVCFKVQFILSDHMLAKNDKRFDNLSDVDFYVDNKIYKYTAGCYTGLKDAVDLQKKLRDNGYKDAFVVAFKGKKRITVKEAQGK